MKVPPHCPTCCYRTNVRSLCEQQAVQQAFRFELDPNRAQRVLLAKSVGARRFVYNWGLAESQRTYALTGKRPELAELKSRLVQLKKSECPWLYEVSAHVGQAALADLDRAFNAFFQGLRGEGSRIGHPRFKRKGERDSARLYEVELSNRYVHLPRIGRVRLKETARDRGFDGRILSATVTRRADRWFCALIVDRQRELISSRPVVRGTDVVGVDFGLKNFAVIHDGAGPRVVEPLRPYRHSQAKLRRLERQLARKQRGSRNYEKARLRRARLHYKIDCQRKNFLHHLSNELSKTKAVIVIEDLHVEGLRQNRRLSLSFNDAGIGELRRQLSYKSGWYGSILMITDRFFPSTQLCSLCGVRNEKMKGAAEV
jgi:putative transposase